MKINIEKKEDGIELNTTDEGDTFWWEGELYMSTDFYRADDTENLIVGLDDGATVWLGMDSIIQLEEVEVVKYEKN